MIRTWVSMCVILYMLGLLLIAAKDPMIKRLGYNICGVAVGYAIRRMEWL